MTTVPPIVLTVAGSDPSGGAGLQADLKTFHQHGAYGMAVPTCLTVQSTRGVSDVEALAPSLVKAQLDTLLEDLAPKAAKTGALGSADTARVVGAIMAETELPWVVDPVWRPTQGRPLAQGDIVEAYREAVIPRAALLTPNVEEAGLLTGMPIRDLREARQAAERLLELGAGAVLLKGGHLEGAARGTDVLALGSGLHELRAERVVDGSFHGTGCALSASIAARLALGADLHTAVAGAKRWLGGALAHALSLGKGAKLVNHLWPLPDEPR